MFSRSAICIAAALVVSLGCSGSPTSPSATASGPSLPIIGESANYVFRASPGDTVDAAWQETYHAWAIAALGVSSTRRITYNKYTSRAHMQSVTGVGNTNAYADRASFALHTLWPTDNHEVIHLFTSGWGDPVALVNEGTAVAFQIDPLRDLTPRWSGTPLHELARQFRQQGRLWRWQGWWRPRVGAPRIRMWFTPSQARSCAGCWTSTASSP